MATFAVLLLGWISLGGLGTDLLPNVQTPVITVDLRVPGKSPQEMEERYTRRLERDISTVSGVDRVYSMTRSGQAVVVAEFTWDTDMDFAVLDDVVVDILEEVGLGRIELVVADGGNNLL